MRKESFDIDTAIHTPQGLENLSKLARAQKMEIFYMKEFGGLFVVHNGLPVSIHLGNIYGVNIDMEQHGLVLKDVRVLKPEVLASLKLRRKTKDSKPR